ncbi:MAG: heavy metal translocating P-type ATPase, partial [Oscillospiraceae bacterium]
MKEIFKITGMTCSACSSHIEKSIKKLKGVKNVSVNLLLNKMEVEFNEKLLTSYDIIANVKKSGYGATLQDKNKNINTDGQSSEKIKESQMKKRFFWSLIFMIPLMIIAMYHMISPIMPQFLNDFYNNIFGGSENAISFILIQFLLTLPVLIINKDYFSKGFKNIIKLSPNMDSLIAIGSSAAVIYGIYALFAVGYFLGRGQSQNAIHYLHNLYFESAAMILTLITLGKYLEEKSKGKTSEAVKKLIDLAPKTATIIENGQELTVPADTLKNGDIIIVK